MTSIRDKYDFLNLFVVVIVESYCYYFDWFKGWGLMIILQHIQKNCY